MSSKSRMSAKHLQINKSQSTIVIMAAIAAFMVVFSAVASKSLVDQIIYNNRVISAKKEAVGQLATNIEESEKLLTAYKVFVGNTKNVLGGNPQGTGPRDGDNAKIVLNALPSVYDFPALTTSIEKLVLSQKLEIASITGSDDEVAQSATTSSPNPVGIEIPFELSATGQYAAVQSTIDVFGKSIRPFNIQSLQLSGGQASMTLTMTGKAFYQPAKNFNITKKVVK